jgi:Flp pilus assembly protein TadG
MTILNAKKLAPRGFLSRLRDDVSGNAMILVAAATVPLAGIIGAAVDVSRTYMVKTRLQQACDAGALVGRKVMGSDEWTTSGTTSAKAQADSYFAANFSADMFSATNVTSSFTENTGDVLGAATATVPMTIMRIFGNEARTVNVSCKAELTMGSTDVMFVLDTTGSMSNKNSGDSQTRIEGLRAAVMSFYDSMDVSISDNAQLRYGFVPYSQNVNVGSILYNANADHNWMVQNHTYQSRVWTDAQSVTTTTLGDPTAVNWVQNGGGSSGGGGGNNGNSGQSGNGAGYTQVLTGGTNYNNTYSPGVIYYNFPGTSNDGWYYLGKDDCEDRNDDGFAINPAQESNKVTTYGDPVTTTNASTGVVTTTQTRQEVTTTTRYKWTWQKLSGSGSNTKRCYLNKSTSDSTANATGTSTQTPITSVTSQQDAGWTYKPVALDVTAFLAGTAVSVPVGTAGAAVSSTWDGCVEEVNTVSDAAMAPVPAGAYDMNINLIPSSQETRWRPTWPTATYLRQGPSEEFRKESQSQYGGAQYSCPFEARKMDIMSRTAVQDYVDDLTPDGNTWHDIGMIWGARLIAPNGLFAATNGTTPSGNPIQRHIIMMTDGYINTQLNDYSPYGVERLERKVTNGVSTPTMNTFHTNRFLAACAAARRENVTVWFVSFGSDALTTPMYQCTGDDPSAPTAATHTFRAVNSAALTSTFTTIAKQIGSLRIGQ